MICKIVHAYQMQIYVKKCILTLSIKPFIATSINLYLFDNAAFKYTGLGSKTVRKYLPKVGVSPGVGTMSAAPDPKELEQRAGARDNFTIARIASADR